MAKRTLVTLAVVAAIGAGAYATRDSWSPKVQSFLPGASQAAKGPPPARAVSVVVASAEKKPVPVQIEAIGTVTPIASVALKSRVETTITEVHFTDGALVKQGDILFTLDSRQIDALLQQAQGTLARDTAQLEGIERDIRRFTDLISKGATTQTNLDNSKTQGEQLRGTMKASASFVENLQVQKSFTVIRAPITGRIGAANVKVGNFVRPADTAPLAVINQMAPVYVTFTIPQRLLPELRDAMAEGVSKVTAVIPGTGKSETGTVAMIDNSVDTATGMVTVRASMDNAKETLWPGTLVNVTLTIRNEDSVVVPTVAVQRSQTGSFVFVIKDNVASIQPVTVSRTFGGMSVVGNGLSGTEQIVTDGQLQLSNGARVAPRVASKAGA